MRASVVGTGYPFFCGSPEPCQDDPTFLGLGAFPCDTDALDICNVDPNAGAACPVSACQSREATMTMMTMMTTTQSGSCAESMNERINAYIHIYETM